MAPVALMITHEEARILPAALVRTFPTLILRNGHAMQFSSIYVLECYGQYWIRTEKGSNLAKRNQLKSQPDPKLRDFGCFNGNEGREEDAVDDI